jgi:hypothetical protein
MLHNWKFTEEKLQKRDESLFIIHVERETTLMFIHAEVLEKIMKFSIRSHIT